MKDNDNIKVKLQPHEAEYIKDLILRNDYIIRAQIKAVLKEHYSQFGEDCKSEVALLACQKIFILKQHENPDAWITVAAHNVASNMMRKIITRSNRTIEKEVNDSPCEEMGYEEVMFNMWLENGSIERLLSILTPHERKIYELLYKKRLNSNEVAKIMNTSSSTIRNTKSVIKKKINEAIKSYNF